MVSEQELLNAIDTYGDMVKRLCVVYLKNEADSEDIFQSVFLKYYQTNKNFQSAEHLKAWLIRVTINACKDHLRDFFNSHKVGLDEVIEKPVLEDPLNKEVFEAVLSLEKKYREVIYLYYYEGYKADEISKLLHKNTNTIYSLLSRAREKLKILLGGEEID